jgi:hypothetical protein
MPQGMETYRQYGSQSQFTDGAKEMISLGWTLEHVSFKARRRFFGLLADPNGRTSEAHYLR